MHLWLLGALGYLTLFGLDTFVNSWGALPYKETYQGKRSFALICAVGLIFVASSFFLHSWLGIFPVEVLNLWLLGALVYFTLLGIDTVENRWCAFPYTYTYQGKRYFALIYVVGSRRYLATFFTEGWKSWSRPKRESYWYKHQSHQFFQKTINTGRNIAKSYCKNLKRSNL